MSHPAATAACDAAEGMLRRWIGLDVTTIGRSALERAVRSRMRATGTPDADSFLRLLAAGTDERDRLVEEIVVAESWFFRDQAVFESLQRYAATLCATAGRRRLRVLCVPCAAGEEPYSVAMALLDAGLDASTFTIDAVDVSRHALARAASATYHANSFRNADLGFRDRWFRIEGGAAQLHASVRECVRFSWGNILDEDFLGDREAYDVIFCRNLLIYLTADARSRVEGVLDRLLASDGILALGAAEPPILRGPWIPAAEHSSFTLRRGPRQATVSAAPRRPAIRRVAESGNSPVSGLVSGGNPPPLGAVPPVADSPPPRAARDSGGHPAVEDVLREAGRLANLGRHAEALQLCELHARHAGPSPEVFFLMAMLHQSAGDLDRAEACLHKTLYLDAHHDEALLCLALIASRRGDATMAEHYRQSAARALAHQGDR